MGDNGTMFAFGAGEDGQLGNGSCGAAHSCVTGVKKGMWTWGSNDYSQLGHSDGERRVADPTAVPDMAERNVKFIAAGYFHTMACALNHTQTDKEKADYKVLTGDKKKAEMMRGNKNKNISELPVWLQKAVNSGAEDRAAKVEDKKDQRKLLKMEEVMEKKRKRQDNEVRALYTWGDGGQGQLGHGNLYTEEYFNLHNPITAVTKLRKFTKLPRPRIVEHIMEACKKQVR